MKMIYDVCISAAGGRRTAAAPGQVRRNACEFALEDDATLSYAEEKQLQSVQEQIEVLLPQQEQGFTMEQTM